MSKAIEYNLAQQKDGKFTDEMVVQLVRAWQKTHGLTADGFCGPATQASIASSMVVETAPSKWPPFDGILARVPANMKEVYATYGNPGSKVVDPNWQAQNIITVRDLPGIPEKFYFACHRIVEPYMREGLRRARIAAPEYKIERAASFVFRHQRHDERRPLSYHAWGIAIDINSDDNFSKTFENADITIAPWSPTWQKIWPKGIPQLFVEAMESVGFAWGGRWKGGFVDPMHFEMVGTNTPV